MNHGGLYGSTRKRSHLRALTRLWAARARWRPLDGSGMTRRPLPSPAVLVGYRRDGRPIYPVLGVSSDADSNDVGAPTAGVVSQEGCPGCRLGRRHRAARSTTRASWVSVSCIADGPDSWFAEAVLLGLRRHRRCRRPRPAAGNRGTRPVAPGSLPLTAVGDEHAKYSALPPSGPRSASLFRGAGSWPTRPRSGNGTVPSACSSEGPGHVWSELRRGQRTGWSVMPERSGGDQAGVRGRSCGPARDR
ncbi:hypothetical protein SUDANB105_00027 [Streptomyces sp. enrichment culture]